MQYTAEQWKMYNIVVENQVLLTVVPCLRCKKPGGLKNNEVDHNGNLKVACTKCKQQSQGRVVMEEMLAMEAQLKNQ